MKELSIRSNGCFPFSAAKSCYKYVPPSIFISANLRPGAARRPPVATGSAGSGEEETCTWFQEANGKVATRRGSPRLLGAQQPSGFI